MSSGPGHAAAQADAAGQTALAPSRRDDTEEASAAVAMADEMAAAEAAEPETALEMLPPTEIAEPPAGPMDMDMAQPGPMFQHQDFDAGADSHGSCVQLSTSNGAFAVRAQ